MNKNPLNDDPCVPLLTMRLYRVRSVCEESEDHHPTVQ